MRALVQALVAKGASALARNVYQRTPLMEAVLNLEEDVVKDLLVATCNGERVDVDLEGKDEQGKTALHLAAEYGAETVVQACTRPRTTYSVLQADSSSQASPLPGVLHSLHRDLAGPG
jgi:ankyrin repeat protein